MIIPTSKGVSNIKWVHTCEMLGTAFPGHTVPGHVLMLTNGDVDNVRKNIDKAILIVIDLEKWFPNKGEHQNHRRL